jgi:recombination protein RecR
VEEINNSLSSKLLEAGVNELAKLPGIGKKTALRLALHLLKQENHEVEIFGNTLIKMKSEIKFCKRCYNISDNELCQICASPKRDEQIICVIEDIKDVMSIENTAQFRGLYHILGGLISPIDGISPHDLTISQLINRIENENVTEIILALPATVEGDTTCFYLYRKLSEKIPKITVIARGVSVGNDLEYTDEITLGRSILNRTIYSGS